MKKFENFDEFKEFMQEFAKGCLKVLDMRCVTKTITINGMRYPMKVNNEKIVSYFCAAMITRGSYKGQVNIYYLYKPAMSNVETKLNVTMQEYQRMLKEAK